MMKMFYPFVIWLEKYDLSCGLMSPFIILSIAFALSAAMFHLDSDIDQVTNRRRWSTARGDTAEILGWVSGMIY